MPEKNNNVNVDVASKIFEPSDLYGSASYPKVEQCIHECHVTNSSETQSPRTHPSCEYGDVRELRGVDTEVTR